MYLFIIKELKSRKQILKEIEEAFKLFDQDGSGSISVDELASVMRLMGQQPTEEELNEMIHQVHIFY